MTRSNPLYQDLKTELIHIYQTNANSAGAIEDRINSLLSDTDHASRLSFLDQLINEFETEDFPDVQETTCPQGLLIQMIQLMLGQSVTGADINEGLLENLGKSLDTVFESLSRLTATMGTALLEEQDSDQTIRPNSPRESLPLEHYISRIAQAFGESEKAAKMTAHAKIKEILYELSPVRIRENSDVSKLSPVKKSKYFEAYELKYEAILKWFESGGFMESFLNEFEEKCSRSGNHTGT